MKKQEILKKIEHFLWQYDNRIDFEEEMAKEHWNDKLFSLFLDMVEGLVPEKEEGLPITDIARTDEELACYYAEIEGHDRAIDQFKQKIEELRK